MSRDSDISSKSFDPSVIIIRRKRSEKRPRSFETIVNSNWVRGHSLFQSRSDVFLNYDGALFLTYRSCFQEECNHFVSSAGR